MKNAIFIPFIFTLLLAACSCTHGSLELEGKVLDENTRVAIPHRVIVVQALLKGNDEKVTPVYYGKFSTDSSGYFKYHLNKSKNAYLYNFCVVGDSTYAYSNIKLGLTELKRDGKLLSFTINKLTDLSIRIQCKGGTSADDVLYVSWKSDEINGNLLYPYSIKNYGYTAPNAGLKWTGKNIRSKIKTRVFANKETIIRWEIYSDGKSRITRDTIICRRDVPNYYDLKY
jgi:hypothetical protein